MRREIVLIAIVGTVATMMFIVGGPHERGPPAAMRQSDIVGGPHARGPPAATNHLHSSVGVRGGGDDFPECGTVRFVSQRWGLKQGVYDQARCKAEHRALRDMAVTLVAFLAERRVRWFLEGGALLGLKRHGALIPWDGDVDLCVIIERGMNGSGFNPRTWMGELLSFNEARPSSPYAIKGCEINEFLQCTTAFKFFDKSHRWDKSGLFVEGPHIDIQPILVSRDGTSFRYTNAFWTKQQYPVGWVVPIRPCNFYGATDSQGQPIGRCPNDSDNVLTYLFGRLWMEVAQVKRTAPQGTENTATSSPPARSGAEGQIRAKNARVPPLLPRGARAGRPSRTPPAPPSSAVPGGQAGVGRRPDLSLAWEERGKGAADTARPLVNNDMAAAKARSLAAEAMANGMVERALSSGALSVDTPSAWVKASELELIFAALRQDRITSQQYAALKQLANHIAQAHALVASGVTERQEYEQMVRQDRFRTNLK